MTPSDLVQAARADGMSALGLADHNLLTGAVEFAAACKAASIRPIIGLEINLNEGPVSLLATSLEGWSNLCRLSSAIALRDDPAAPCSLAVLASYSKDLVALSSQCKYSESRRGKFSFRTCTHTFTALRSNSSCLLFDS